MASKQSSASELRESGRYLGGKFYEKRLSDGSPLQTQNSTLNTSTTKQGRGANLLMACLIAPAAAVLIVNRRESKDKIMVRCCCVVSVGWLFLQWVAIMKQKIFLIEVLTLVLDMTLCFCSSCN